MSRILTTHAGSLPRPEGLAEMVAARARGETVDERELARRIRDGVAEAVRLQVASGIDSVNDGELSKTNFVNYVRERLGGIDPKPGEPEPSSITKRDKQEFAEYFTQAGRRGFVTVPAYCRGPITYTGRAAAQADIENFRAALEGVEAAEAFLTAVTPGTIEHFLRNEHYADDQAFLYAIADAMHEEYKAIADAGFLLQIDDPDLPDGWQMYPEMDVAAYRRYAEVRIDALNHALRDIPEERIRFHTCWGSYHGPHKYDIPLEHIVDLILKVKAVQYSIEASNPRHAHEWKVWEDVKLPDGKVLIPGVIGHYSDFIEHPELVAQRLVTYANLVGQENLMAGTDCGLGTRVGHPKICWAKFEAMAEGARLAAERLKVG